MKIFVRLIVLSVEDSESPDRFEKYCGFSMEAVLIFIIIPFKSSQKSVKRFWMSGLIPFQQGISTENPTIFGQMPLSYAEAKKNFLRQHFCP